jgi:hypothetical protein
MLDQIPHAFVSVKKQVKNVILPQIPFATVKEITH